MSTKQMIIFCDLLCNWESNAMSSYYTTTLGINSNPRTVCFLQKGINSFWKRCCFQAQGINSIQNVIWLLMPIAFTNLKITTGVSAQIRFVNGGSSGKFHIEKLHKLPERRFMKLSVNAFCQKEAK